MFEFADREDRIIFVWLPKHFLRFFLPKRSKYKLYIYIIQVGLRTHKQIIFFLESTVLIY